MGGWRDGGMGGWGRCSKLKVSTTLDTRFSFDSLRNIKDFKREERSFLVLQNLTDSVTVGRV